MNGTVVATGNNDSGQCNVSEWKDIVAIYAGSSATHGLKMDGTVVSTGSIYSVETNNVIMVDGDYSLCTLTSDGRVSEYGWTDIIDISDNDICAGVKKDGTVLLNVPDYYDDLIPDVSTWKNIVSVDQSMYLLVGLRSDGTVVASPKMGTQETVLDTIATWKNVIAISVDTHRIVALTSTGKVLSTGNGKDAQVSGWNNIKLP